MNSWLDTFLRKSLDNYKQYVPLAGGASTRTYFRVLSGDKSYIACLDPQFRGRERESYPFFIVYGLFQEIGIPVPQIFASDNQHGFLLLEDVGEELLENRLSNLDKSAVENIYKK
jgi:hypothetical protein